jgi:uncharacterized protein (TIGR03118 family)
MRASIHKLCLFGIAAAVVTRLVAGPIGFNTTLLASDQPGVAAATDPGLINPWGLTASASSPFWLSVNGSGTSELYSGAGVKQGLVVSIPGAGTPTGVVFSNVAGSFNGDTFLFTAEDGTIAGWRGALGTTAETLTPGSASNVYKGLALGTVAGNTYAYAANFRAGTIDVLKGNAADPSLTGTFNDPRTPCRLRAVQCAESWRHPLCYVCVARWRQAR